MDTRWPKYRADAIAATPVRSILAFELFTSDQTFGALNVYADTPHAFDAGSPWKSALSSRHTPARPLVWDSVRREHGLQRCPGQP